MVLLSPDTIEEEDIEAKFDNGEVTVTMEIQRTFGSELVVCFFLPFILHEYLLHMLTFSHKALWWQQ